MGSTAITLLSLLAIVLILAGIGALFFFRKSSLRPASRYQVPARPVRSPEDELNSLGILEIRPKGAASSVVDDAGEEEDAEIIHVDESEEPDGAEQTEDEEEDPDMAAASEEEEAPAEEIEMTTSLSGNYRAVAKRGGVSRREALFRLMNAVQSSVDGYTACLIKREIDGRCNIEALVSQNPQALDSERFDLDALLLGDNVQETAVTVLDVGTTEIPTEALSYYTDSVSVRQLAIAPVKGTDRVESYYLLVDALAWQDLDDPWQRLMIGQFATLIGTFLATPMSEGDGEFVRPRIRPRREIIAEEIEKARTHEHPLALALIYLNRAEEVADAGDKTLSEVERTMALRLEAAVNGGRLERFGELTYGVFHADDVSEVEAWALQLQEELSQEGVPFDGGVSIGIALLQDRHEGADDFRADATEALREAFETGACTIIE